MQCILCQCNLQAATYVAVAACIVACLFVHMSPCSSQYQPIQQLTMYTETGHTASRKLSNNNIPTAMWSAKVRVLRCYHAQMTCKSDTALHTAYMCKIASWPQRMTQSAERSALLRSVPEDRELMEGPNGFSDDTDADDSDYALRSL